MELKVFDNSGIPSKRVHSKRIPKFSKTSPGILNVPFNFGPEISEFVVEWKAPGVVLFSGNLDIPEISCSIWHFYAV